MERRCLGKYWRVRKCERKVRARSLQVEEPSVGAAEISLGITDLVKEAHRRGLESLGRDLVVDGVGWDLNITRSALLQDIREDLVESFSPGSIGDWRDSIQ